MAVRGVSRRILVENIDNDALRALRDDCCIRSDVVDAALHLVNEEAMIRRVPVRVFCTVLFNEWMTTHTRVMDGALSCLANKKKADLTRLRHWLGCVHLISSMHWIAVDVCIMGYTRRVTIYDSLLEGNTLHYCYGLLSEDMRRLDVPLKGNLGADASKTLAPYAPTLHKIVLFLEYYLQAREVRIPERRRAHLESSARAGTRKWLLEIRGHAAPQHNVDCGPLCIRLIQRLALGADEDPTVPRPHFYIPVADREDTAKTNAMLHAWQRTKDKELFAQRYPNHYMLDGWRSTIEPEEAALTRREFYRHLSGFANEGLEFLDTAHASYTPLVAIEDLLALHLVDGRNPNAELVISVLCPDDPGLEEELILGTEHILRLLGVDDKIPTRVEDYLIEDADLIVDLSIRSNTVVPSPQVANALNSLDDIRPVACLYGFRQDTAPRYLDRVKANHPGARVPCWYMMALVHKDRENTALFKRAQVRPSHDCGQFVGHHRELAEEGRDYELKLKYMSVGMV